MASSRGVRRFPNKTRLTLCLLGVAGLVSGFAAWRQARLAPVREHIAQGVQLMQSGQKSAAQSQWREAVRLDPQNVQAWELLGDLSLGARDFVAAREAFEHVLQLDPTSSDVRVRLAKCALETKDAAGAARYVQDQLKDKPDDVAALQFLATIQEQKGSSQEQLQTLKRLVKVQPRSAKALENLLDVLEARTEFEAMIPFADSLVKLEPDSAKAHFKRGVALFTGDADEKSNGRAEEDFKKVLAQEPDNFEAHRYLARIDMRQGKAREAIAHFEAIGRGRPYASAHLLELANAYRRVGDVRRAEQLRSLFTRLKDFNTRAYELTRFLGAHPDSAESFLQLSALMVRGVESEDAFYQLLRYRFLSHNILSAAVYADRAAQLQPKKPSVIAAQKQLEAVYARHLKAGLEALEHNQIESAKGHLGRVVLLRADDTRTRAALRIMALRGLDPLGTITSSPATSKTAQ